MRKRLVLAVVAMSLLLFTPPVVAQTALDRARDDVADVTERLEDYLVALEATQRRGNDLAAEYWQVQSGLELLDLEVATSERETLRLAEQQRGLRDEVKVVALDQYVSRSEDLGVGDHASEADRTAAETLARLVVGADIDAVDRLRAVDEQHDQARRVLDTQRDAQAAALADVVDTQSSLSAELEELTELRAALDSELSELETALATLEAAEAQRQATAAEEARIAEERRRAAEAAAQAEILARQVPTPVPTAAPTPTAIPTPTATAVPNPQLPDATAVPTAVPNPQPRSPVSGGGIVCPLAGAFTHTDDFNAPRAVGGIHRANDLISAQGTPVLAAASGTVNHRSSSVGGLSAHLKGDNGDYYFYTHLAGYENEGAGHVAAGTVIGYVGMTGNAPIPHLHFEIHSGGYGNYSNPYGPVRNACF